MKAGMVFAVLASLAAVLTSLALTTLTQTPLYVLLVGAVAVTVWYGGFRPGLVAIVVGWALAFATFVGDDALDLSGEGDLLRWGVALVTALVVVWVSYLMRRGHERAATAAGAAEASVEVMEGLQQLTSALSAAVTSSDVVHELILRTPYLVGARGGAVGFLDGDELIVADPVGVAAQTHRPGTRLSLASRAPIVAAVSTRAPVVVRNRREFEAHYPDGASLTPYATAAIAVPLRVAGEVVGSMSILFDRSDAVHADAESIAQIAANLGGQALERSRLFDEEQALRRRTERLQRMTASLSNALTRQDVADVVVDAVAEIAEVAGVAFAVVNEERRVVRMLSWRGYRDDVLEPLLEVSLDLPTPGNTAIRRRRSAFYGSMDDIRAEFPEAADDLEPLEHTCFLLAPLIAGRRVNGLLMTSWQESYPLSDEEKALIDSLATQAAQALDRAEHFESERTIAETLQRIVLPVTLPQVDGVELAARYLPGTAELDVGGDWFDAIPLVDGRIGLVVGDVVGKGVQAAANMGQLRNALRAFTLDPMKPSSTISRLSRFADEALGAAFATVVYAVVDPAARVCRYTSAGHPPPLVAYPDGRVELLEGGRGLPLGTVTGAEYEQDVVPLPAAGVLLLYTDGLVERRGHPIDDGFRRLCDAVRSGPRDPEGLVEHVLEQMVGEGQRGDDIALLALRLAAQASEPLELRLPRELTSLHVVRDSLRSWLESAEIPRSEAEEVVLAAWEACANAVEHAREPVGEHVTFSARIADSTLVLEIRDSGQWVPPSERTDRGFGLRLMRELMSSVDIARSAEGTRVTMVRRLDVET